MTHAKQYVEDRTAEDTLAKIINGTIFCKVVEKKLTLIELGDLVRELIQ